MSKKKEWEAVYAQLTRNIVEASIPDVQNIGLVTSLDPFKVEYKGVEFSSDTDIIFCNGLLLEPNVVLPIDTITQPQNMGAVTPPLHNTPVSVVTAFTATISGTIPDFIKAEYEWWKAWHDRFILHVGDSVLCQRIGENKLIVINKMQQIGGQNSGE